MARNKLNFFVHWLPGIALFLKIYNVLGERIFDNFFVVFLLCILCAGVGLCWVTFSFFVASLVRNITWQRMGYHQCFYIIFPFVYLKGEGFHLISTTLSYHCALFDSLPKDFVEQQSKDYNSNRNQLCVICERNAMIAYGAVNIILVGLLFLDFSWILVLLTIWLQATYMYIMDTPEHKGLYTKYKDYNNEKAIFYLAKSAAYQGKLYGELMNELLFQAKNNQEFVRFSLLFYKTLKAQCICSSIRGGIDDELFHYIEEENFLHHLQELTSFVGQEKLELLKIFVDSAVLNKNQQQKQWLHQKFSKLDYEFVQNIGDSLFDIWRNMLVGEIPKGVTNHKYDQTKQILSDTDIYNRKIYREYNEAWQQLYRSLEKVFKL